MCRGSNVNQYHNFFSLLDSSVQLETIKFGLESIRSVRVEKKSRPEDWPLAPQGLSSDDKWRSSLVVPNGDHIGQIFPSHPHTNNRLSPTPQPLHKLRKSDSCQLFYHFFTKSSIILQYRTMNVRFYFSHGTKISL